LSGAYLDLRSTNAKQVTDRLSDNIANSIANDTSKDDFSEVAAIHLIGQVGLHPGTAIKDAETSVVGVVVALTALHATFRAMSARIYELERLISDVAVSVK